MARFHEQQPGHEARGVAAQPSSDDGRSPGAYVTLGFTHVIFHLVPPYDAETLERFVSEVRPALAG